jgi:ribosomal protein L34E
MTCHACETHNDANRRYCAECGEFLIALCGRCSFANQVKDRFCGGCGEALQATQTGRPAATRKERSSSAKGAQRQPLSLSPSELRELLEKEPQKADADLPNKISQDELDRLFGTTT